MDISTTSGDKGAKSASLGAVPKLDRIKLSDGNEYNLAPVDVNLLCDFEEYYPDKAAGELIATGRMQYIRYMVYLRLRREYPDMTVERVGALIDVDVLVALKQQLGV